MGALFSIGRRDGVFFVTTQVIMNMVRRNCAGTLPQNGHDVYTTKKFVLNPEKMSVETMSSVYLYFI